jgi:hypothetical protein
VRREVFEAISKFEREKHQRWRETFEHEQREREQRERDAKKQFQPPLE